MNTVAKLVVWQVWSTSGPVNRFFASRREAEHYIDRHFGAVHLHPDDSWHVWTRENYAAMSHHPDGLNLWMGWTRDAVIHLERHEIDPTVRAIVTALNHYPKLHKRSI